MGTLILPSSGLVYVEANTVIYEENIGKIVSIDIEMGEYAVDADPVVAGLRVQSKHLDAAIYGKRIGYNAAFALGDTLTRTVK